jgi:hypothetical protein
MTGALTLEDVAARTDVLVMACSRCDRAGRYRVQTLIGHHGRGYGVPALLRTPSADCPKRQAAASIYDLCGIYCPEPSKLFLASGTNTAADEGG